MQASIIERVEGEGGCRFFSHRKHRQGARWLLPSPPLRAHAPQRRTCLRSSGHRDRGLRKTAGGTRVCRRGWSNVSMVTSFVGRCTSYLVFDEYHLDDLAAALAGLLARKPQLGSRRPVGEIRQAASTSRATVDLAESCGVEQCEGPSSPAPMTQWRQCANTSMPSTAVTSRRWQRPARTRCKFWTACRRMFGRGQQLPGTVA
jgi:hypothetical protein